MKLINYLKMRRISKAQFSRTVGCDVSHIRRMINKGASPSAALARRIEMATCGQVNRLELLYPSEYEKQKRATK